MANGVATTGLLSGMVRVFEAGERLLVDQAELVRLESREKLAFFVTRFGLIAGGVVFLFTAWVAAWVAAIVAVDAIPLAARIATAALAQLAVGAGMLFAARRNREDDDATP
ncbi:MAG TPA: phage holin family protein [Myxococcota bacterium]|nr:phage holin family protein [Myxococcota bacterium]